MRVELRSASDGRADMLVGLVCEENTSPAWLKSLGLDDVPGLEDIRGKKGELTLLHPGADQAYPRLCLVGIGKAEHQGEEQWGQLLARVRSALGMAMSKAEALEVESVAFAVDSLTVLNLSEAVLPRVAHEVVYAFRMALYHYTALKKAEDRKKSPVLLSLVYDSSSEICANAAARAIAEAEAVCLARDLVNTPSNLLGPMGLAEKARELCASLPVSCMVLGREALFEEGMECFLSVAKGSAQEPALVRLEYTPPGQEDAKPLILVGKGISFDSGGISLKPGQGMHEMKTDMAGAAAVLATMVLIGKLGAPRRVVGLMACAENMPDALATRPGDVVRTMKGTTVEILNTDAEGRLVLCDTLTYAQKYWQPEALVDIATLTGACIVALGTDVAGVFSNDDVLAGDISRSGMERGEYFWRMPTWDMYAEGLQSPAADLGNIGGREGGAVTAALFLKHFVDDGVKWAHLDIAGPAYSGKKKPGNTGGATGFGVRTLASLAGL